MGINDDGIAAVGKDLMETTIDLLSTMVDEDSELICLYYEQMYLSRMQTHFLMKSKKSFRNVK